MIKVLQMLASPLIGTHGNVALGRLAFCIAFGVSVYFWLAEPIEVYPSTLWDTMLILLAYNFSTKIAGKFGAQNWATRRCDDLMAQRPHPGSGVNHSPIGKPETQKGE